MSAPTATPEAPAVPRSVVGAVAASVSAVGTVVAGFLPAVHTHVSTPAVTLDAYSYVTGLVHVDGQASPPAQPLNQAFLTGLALVLVFASMALAQARWSGRPLQRWHVLVPALMIAWSSFWTWEALLQPPEASTDVSLGSGGLLLLVALVAGLVAWVDAARALAPGRPGARPWLGEAAVIGGLGLAVGLWVPAYVTTSREAYVSLRVVSTAGGDRQVVTEPTLVTIALVVVPALAVVAIGVCALLPHAGVRRFLDGRAVTAVSALALSYALMTALTTSPSGFLSGITSDAIKVTAGSWLGMASKLLIVVASVIWLRRPAAAPEPQKSRGPTDPHD